MTQRPIQTTQTVQMTCRFYTEPDSREFPRVVVNTADKENPCLETAHNWKINERLVMDMIGLSVCALQRKCEVCPRGLTESVDPSLVPFKERK